MLCYISRALYMSSLYVNKSVSFLLAALLQRNITVEKVRTGILTVLKATHSQIHTHIQLYG